MSEATKKLVAGHYGRRSDEQNDRDAEAKSLARQLDGARAFAAKMGWQFSEDHVWQDDGVPAADWALRHGFKNMMAALDVPGKAPIDVLIVSEASRIGRDATYFPYYLNRIEDSDVAVWDYLKRERISVATEGDQVQTMFSAMGAAYESQRASERSLDELKRRAQAGRVAGGKIYGYQNYRPREGVRVERVIDPEQAKVVVKVFELVADGWGYGRIARYLNGEKIPGPKTLGKKEQAKRIEAGETIDVPTWSLSGVRELVRRHDLYVGGRYTWGLKKRSRKKGSKLRLKRAAVDENIVTVVNDAWKIVDPELARRALARIEAYNSTIVRSGVGVGKERTRFVSKPETSGRGQYLLSGFLRCGAVLPSGQTCSAPMTVSKRGRRGLHGYACSSAKEHKGCTSRGAVQMKRLDAAVIASLRSTFSVEALETYLGQQAANVAKIAEHQATRARLVDEELPRLSKVIERLGKRLAQIDDDVAAVVQGELKAAVADARPSRSRSSIWRALWAA